MLSHQSFSQCTESERDSEKERELSQDREKAAKQRNRYGTKNVQEKCRFYKQIRLAKAEKKTSWLG